ncbi:uncharacterized protein LOC106176713 isoform X2 [Lingula anatina]|uniref:Uncharacterized protein LOC106176713 isoform X2 n=1 Tax=Lingula anatina TaxID=7574 RepID=A0A1S3JWB7_LINAN|nr:uncharacterized protein LOC106176713 isoform X2 [Lingula anatina]|eukprot:XP_013414663.1 uncharacterized protein LOC106176713 isoform X2 [Lingula anatina]
MCRTTSIKSRVRLYEQRNSDHWEEQTAFTMNTTGFIIVLLLSLANSVTGRSLATALGHTDHRHNPTPPVTRMYVLKNGDCVTQGDIMLSSEECFLWAQRIRENREKLRQRHGNTEEEERTHAHGTSGKSAGMEDEEELEEISKRKSESNTAPEQLTNYRKNWRVYYKHPKNKDVKRSHQGEQRRDTENVEDQEEKSGEHVDDITGRHQPVHSNGEHGFKKPSNHVKSPEEVEDHRSSGHDDLRSSKKPSHHVKSPEEVADHRSSGHDDDDSGSKRHHGERDVTVKDESDVNKRSDHPHSPAGVVLYHKGRVVETSHSEEQKHKLKLPNDAGSPARMRGFSSASGDVSGTNKRDDEFCFC